MKKTDSKIESPFDLEILRTSLATTKDYKRFKKTYDTAFPIIKADNTNKFWSNKFKFPESFRDLDPMTKEKIDFLISQLPRKKCKILDLGIGQAYLEQRLQQLGIEHEVYGIDISETSIKRADKNHIGNFTVGNVLDIDKYYKENFFDVVVSIEVIEHISPNKIFKLYEKVHAVLKKNGIFIISTPLNEGLRHMKTNPSAHVREYSIPILEAEFKLSEFKIINKKSLYAFSSWYKLKKILANLISSKWKPNNVSIIARKA